MAYAISSLPSRGRYTESVRPAARYVRPAPSPPGLGGCPRAGDSGGVTTPSQPPDPAAAARRTAYRALAAALAAGVVGASLVLLAAGKTWVRGSTGGAGQGSPCTPAAARPPPCPARSPWSASPRWSPSSRSAGPAATRWPRCSRSAASVSPRPRSPAVPTTAPWTRRPPPPPASPTPPPGTPRPPPGRWSPRRRPAAAGRRPARPALRAALARDVQPLRPGRRPGPGPHPRARRPRPGRGPVEGAGPRRGPHPGVGLTAAHRQRPVPPAGPPPARPLRARVFTG